MKRVILAAGFLCCMVAAALGYNHKETPLVEPSNQLCRDNRGQYVSCSPGGNGNLTCSAACGVGSVCLAIDNLNHGRCHIPGSQNP